MNEEQLNKKSTGCRFWFGFSLLVLPRDELTSFFFYPSLTPPCLLSHSFFISWFLFFFLKFGRQRETVESPLSWVIYHAAQKGQPIKTRVLSFKLYGRAIYGLIKQRQLLCFVFWSVFFRFQIFFWSGPLVSSFLLFPLSGIFRLEQ